MIATCAEAFHQSPYSVAQELDTDPERLYLLCLPMLNYARAFDANKNAKKEIKAPAGSLLALAQDVEFDRAQEEIDALAEVD